MLEIDSRSQRRSMKYHDVSGHRMRIIRNCIVTSVILVILAAGGWFAYTLRKGIEPPVNTTYKSSSSSKALNPSY